MSLRDDFPLRLLIGREDCSYLVDEGLTFSNVDPGGFEMASIPIPKDMPESIAGTAVRIECGAGEVAWEGRISQPQRSLGNRTLITCEGNAAVFKDSDLAMIFVDRDLTQWQGPPLTRQIYMTANGWSIAGPQVAADPQNNSPAVTEVITGAWGAVQPLVEAWYDARGMAIQHVYYVFNTGAKLDASNVNWVWDVELQTDASHGTTTGTGNLRVNAGSGSGTLTTSSTSYPYAFLQLYFGAQNSGASGYQYLIYWQTLAVYGDHGISPVSSGGGRGITDTSGFYPSDIVSYVLGQASGSPIQAGTIQATDSSAYIIPHLVYYTAVTLDQILNDMSQISGWTWGVWESPSPLTGDSRPRLDFKPRPASGTWTAWAWRKDCDSLDLRPDLGALYNSAIVNYTTVDGLQRAVTVTIDNPLLDAVNLNRTVVLDAGTSTSSAATTFGQMALTLMLDQAQVAGTATITQAIHRAPSGRMAPWMLKAGQDRLRVPDLPSADAYGTYNDLPVRRVECSVGAEGFSTSVEFGQGANLVETLQARLAEAQQLAGVGG